MRYENNRAQSMHKPSILYGVEYIAHCEHQEHQLSHPSIHNCPQLEKAMPLPNISNP